MRHSMIVTMGISTLLLSHSLPGRPFGPTAGLLEPLTEASLTQIRGTDPTLWGNPDEYSTDCTMGLNTELKTYDFLCQLYEEGYPCWKCGGLADDPQAMLPYPFQPDPDARNIEKDGMPRDCSTLARTSGTCLGGGCINLLPPSGVCNGTVQPYRYK